MVSTPGIFGIVVLASCRFNFDANGADAPTSGVCPPGLAAHWSLDTPTIDGATVIDVSGNGNTAYLAGPSAPGPAPGLIGGALQFSNQGDGYVDIPNVPLDTSPGGATTVAMWFLRDPLPAPDEVLIYAPSLPRYDVWLTGRAGDQYVCVNTGTDDCWGVKDNGLLGRWVHVVAVLRNGPTTSSELFIDGAKQTLACHAPLFSACTQTSDVTLPLSLGGKLDYFFHGSIDDVFVYDRALADSEVAALFGGACL